MLENVDIFTLAVAITLSLDDRCLNKDGALAGWCPNVYLTSIFCNVWQQGYKNSDPRDSNDELTYLFRLQFQGTPATDRYEVMNVMYSAKILYILPHVLTQQSMKSFSFIPDKIKMP